MPKIIQFLHTAFEAIPKNENDVSIPWNNFETHRRKFIKSPGKYVNEQELEIDEELSFWGEWEPQSQIIKMKNDKKYLPKYLNIPFINPSVPNRTHNTDPYVFGKHFKYIICKQRAFHKVLTNLEENSLILFGSCIDKKFCLDTLFVVSRTQINYNISTIENLFPINRRGSYYHASVNPIYDDTNYNMNINEEDSCRIDEKFTYRFYESVDYIERDKYNGLYSFVPVKIYNQERESSYVFKQPAIHLDFIENMQTQGINSKTCYLNEITGYWEKIAEQIEEFGLKKGTWFKTPELVNSSTK